MVKVSTTVMFLFKSTLGEKPKGVAEKTCLPFCFVGPCCNPRCNGLGHPTAVWGNNYEFMSLNNVQVIVDI